MKFSGFIVAIVFLALLFSVLVPPPAVALAAEADPISAVQSESDKLSELEKQAAAVLSDLTQKKSTSRLNLESRRRNLAEAIVAIDHVLARFFGPVPTPEPQPIPPAPQPQPVPPQPNPQPVPPPLPGPMPNPQPVPVPPQPQPIPPAPTPEPVFPAGTFAVSQDCYKLASLVNSPGRTAEALAMAGAAEGLAAQLAAGTVKADSFLQVNALAGKIGKGFIEAAGANAAAWKDFRTQVAAKASVFYTAGKLSNSAAWAEFLRECALGLKAVK